MVTTATVTPAAAQPTVPAPAAAAEAPPERPDEASARVTARISGQRVEITDLRTETTTTFANPNGSLTTDAASAPIRVRRGQGWVDVDTRLERDGQVVRPRATLGLVEFSGGGDGNMASLTDDEGRRALLRWPGRLPTPSLSGDTATYANVSPATDVVVRALRTGFEQTVVLRERPRSAPVVSLPLQLTGLRVAQAGNGSLRFLDAQGKLVFEAPQPRMWGAQRDPVSGDPVRSMDIATKIVNSASGPVIELRPDASFLADPALTYPVVLDPTIHMTILADTWVSEGSTTTQGTAGDLRSGRWSGSNAVQRSLMKFDSNNYQNRRVMDATLALYNYYSPTCNARESRVYALGAAFDNNTIWSTQPGAIPTIYGSTTSSYGASGCAANWLRMNVTTLVDRWATGAITNHGLLVRAADEADTNAWKRFYSSDYADKAYIPSLSVTYNTYPDSDTPVEAPGDGAVITSTTSPQLRTMFRDADGGTGYMDYEVRDSGGLYTSGRSGSTLSGAAAAWTVATPLNDLVTYRWRSRGWDGLDYARSWSTERSFQINLSPNQPHTLSPVSGTVVTTSTPQLAGTVSDSSGGLLRGAFDIENVSTGQRLVTQAFGSQVGSGSTSTYTIPSGVLSDPNATYRWRMYSHDGVSFSPATGWLTLGLDLPPSTPSNLNPPHNGQVDKLRPTLSGTVSDVNGGTLTSRFWLQDSAGNLLVNQAAGTSVVAGSTAEYVVPADLLATSRSYSWRMQACDTRSCSPQTAWQTFTVNLPPGPVSSMLPANGTALNTATPQLSGVVSDPDGDSYTGRFYVDDALTGAGLVGGGSGSTVPSGGRSSYTVPAGKLQDGGQYAWQMQGCNTGCSDYSAELTFSVDLTAPARVEVGSADYPAGEWQPTSKLSTFHFDNASTDVTEYLYGLDSAPTNRTTGSYVQLTPGPGWHVLRVQARDAAGNVSPVTEHAFGVGSATITAPTAALRTQSKVGVGATASVDRSGVTWKYRRAATDAWTAFTPAQTFDSTDTTPIASWPQATVAPAAGSTAKAASPALVWRVAEDLKTDGPVQMSACFTGSTGPELCSPAVAMALDVDAFGSSYATAPVGPGAVSLLTGNFSLTTQDVSVSGYAADLSVSRTFQTRQPKAHANGYFGPGWAPTLPVFEADATWRSLTNHGSHVTLTELDGDQLFFTAPATGSQYVPAEGSEGLTLVRRADGTFAVTDLDGNTTAFGPAGTEQLPVQVSQPGNGKTTSFFYDGTTRRISLAVTPHPTGAPCDLTTWSTGCRGLLFDYDSGGRLTAVRLKSTDNAGSVTTTAVAAYGYDSTAERRLVEAWDPRISPALKTTYTYDAGGRLATVTPPGEAAWSLGYTDGRLTTMSRPQPNGQTATTTLVYRVPLTGAAGLPGMGRTDVARWGQTDLPTDATAVFPPDRQPPSSLDYRFATVTYMNVAGREVNVVTPGQHVSTTEHDTRGNVVRTLTPGNRARALAAGTSSAQVARQLDAQTRYTSDGVAVTDVWEPAHEVTLADGSVVTARKHTNTTYDTGNEPGHPTPGKTAHLPQRVTVGASLGTAIPGTSVVDTRVTLNEYAIGTNTTGWKLRKPLRVISDPSGLNLVTTTLYDADSGLVTETRLPAGPNGGTAHSTRTLYYTAGAHPSDGDCGNKPAWTRLVCKTQPAAQPGTPGLPGLPVVWTSAYSDLLTPLTVRESVTDSSGVQQTRTTSTTYDAAGRVTSTSVTGSVGKPVPDVQTTYSPTTGQSVETATTSGGVTSRIRREYDSVGQQVAYTDADGVRSTTSYDVAGRRVASSDGKGSYSYTYDRTIDPRGLLTSMSYSGAGSAAGGTVTATYDADGQQATQTHPNGLVATWTRNEAGEPLRLVYAKNGTTWFEDSVTESIHGQWRRRASTFSSQDYGYDRIGRLSRVQDSVAGLTGGGCTIREYGFDANSNRRSLTTRPATLTGQCDPAAAGTTVTRSYDAADRLLGEGYSYDAFGRITTVPATDVTGEAAVNISYYVTDLVAGQTQADQTRAWTLDPNRRLRGWTQSGALGADKVNHYSQDSDSPAWVAESADGSSWTRNVTGISGDLLALQSSDGRTLLQLANLHGDVATSVDPTALVESISGNYETSEFGVARTSTLSPVAGSSQPRYGWLGAKQRSGDTLGGLILMGVRLYNPILGRFLQVDPIVGGNATAYDYVYGDPVNKLDLDGKRCVFGRNANKSCRGARQARWIGVGAVALGTAVVIGAACSVTAGLACVAFAAGYGALGASAGYMVHTNGGTRRYKRAEHASRSALGAVPGLYRLGKWRRWWR